MMEKQKRSIRFWVLNGLIALAILVFIILNWGEVRVDILGLELKGAGFIVFPVIFALGFFSGWLWENLRQRKKQKMKDQAKELHYLEK